ncbi:Non-specific lipid-transfer protein 2 [Capsicum baccatum]|uniref:Non-specific lipid-transfer protein 2 n=1 Tax=Capsicum baccatum TaxID=33114 RepID=A0A2G2WXE4_CAPBA|nr:Non-specific lipid-transfer protein 2 [Capsicum baccatum]
MKKGNSFIAIFLVGTLVLSLGELLVIEAVTCNAGELSPCGPAIFSGEPPTPQCCAKLNEQKPCLCGYINNPSLRPYVTSPNAQKISKACRVPFPKC